MSQDHPIVSAGLIEEPSNDTPTHVVVVDDMEPNAHLLAAMLEALPGVTVSVFTDGAGAVAWCIENDPDLVILDYRMPKLDGLGCLARLRGATKGRETPVILVTADESQATVRAAFDAGTTDFIRKPVNETELIARARNLLSLRLRHLALLRANAELARLANVDSLTGTLNRRRFMEVATRDLARDRRHNRPVSLIMMDVDHFKGINDSFGHAVGDAALSGMAAACRQVLRESDVVARMGGEEFVVLLPETPMPQASEAAERLRATIADWTVDHDGVSVQVTASLGVAQWGGADESLDRLLQRADAALYLAKTGGRNRVIAAAPFGSPARGAMAGR
ncbi:GGDEF domain-containing response regulator [Rhodospira trueperi]|uniref:diguanylate cyclase n=1 Tax=Rhodospira trueperi TaxID=69960 RepID=A0A1G7EH98_9PROT|nr:diguanylate cyclase [Rhodospira trueperi]SDE63028.1 diguanylate cyclase (GGDEF) domain-containing protein [Rhodospira trueperi]